MKRERLDFHRAALQLRDLYWHSLIWGVTRSGPRVRLVPCLAHALETAYMTGALEALGFAQGYPGDDVRIRCLALQRQAAQRLAELRETRDDYGIHTPENRANRTVKRRVSARGDHRYR